MSKGALVVTAKGANVEVNLKLAEMLPTRFTTLGVSAEICWLACRLSRDESEHVGGRRFFDAERSPGKPKIGEVHGKSEPVGGSPSANQHHVLRRERIMPHDRHRVCRRIEQRRARLWREDVTRWHDIALYRYGHKL